MGNKDLVTRLNKFKGIVHLIDVKCNELPVDISSWTLMADKYDSSSKKYENIIKASVNPRLDYLNKLKSLNEKCKQQLNNFNKKLNDYSEIKQLFNLNMPIEQFLCSFADVSQKFQRVTSIGDLAVMNEIGIDIQSIQDDMNQLILRCSDGEFQFKELATIYQYLKPTFIQKIKDKEKNKVVVFNEIKELCIQKIHADVSIRISTRDNALIHSSLVMYLNALENNDDFKQLPSDLQYKIKHIINEPLDDIKFSTNQKSDIAMDELQKIMEPIQGQATGVIPDTALSVHEMIQDSMSQHVQLAKIKMNVVGAINHLMNQMEYLFDYQTLNPVQVSSIIGAAWLKNPLTTPDDIDLFVDELNAIKQSDSYIKLSQCYDEVALEESFSCVKKKMEDVSQSLKINAIVTNGETDDRPIIHANECVKVSPKFDPLKARRKLIGRQEFMGTLSESIENVSNAVRVHLYLLFYEHSLSNDQNINQGIAKILHHISNKFNYESVDSSFVNQYFVQTMVQRLIDSIAHEEMSKNIEIMAKKRELAALVRQIKMARSSNRNHYKKQLNQLKSNVKQLILSINIPRLKHVQKLISVDQNDDLLPQYSLIKISKTLTHMIQEKLVLDQVPVG